MVFHGPGTVILYGDNLLEVTPDQPEWERPSAMLASFDAARAFRAVAGRPSRPDFAMWENLTTSDAFQCLERHSWAVVSEVYRPRSGTGLVPNELLIHLGALVLLWLLART